MEYAYDFCYFRFVISECTEGALPEFLRALQMNRYNHSTWISCP